MSLFSRIDRLRGGPERGDDRDEESVFAIPDLNRTSARAGEPEPNSPALDDAAPSAKAKGSGASFREVSPQVEVEDVREPRAARMPTSRRETLSATSASAEAAPKPGKRLSPLERLARRAAEPETDSEAPAPESSLPDPVILEVTPERSASQKTASSLSDRLRAEPLPDVAAPPAPAPPTERLAAQERLSSERLTSLPDPVRESPEEDAASPRPSRRASLFGSVPEDAPASNVASSEVPTLRQSAAERLARDERSHTGAFSAEEVRTREAVAAQSPLIPATPIPVTPTGTVSPVGTVVLPSTVAASPASAGGTAFDRLMTAHAGEKPDSPKDALRSNAPSLAQRLAAMRAQAEAQPEPASLAPEPVIEAGASAQVVAPEETPVAPQPLPVSSIQEPSEPQTRVVEFSAPFVRETENFALVPVTENEPATREPVAAPVEAAPVEAAPVEAAPVEVAPVEAAFVQLPSSKPDSFVALGADVTEISQPAPVSEPFVGVQSEAPAFELQPEDVAPEAATLPWNAPTIEPTQLAMSMPVSAPVDAPASVAPTSVWAQRLAGRNALRDTPVVPTEPGVLAPAASSDAPTEALDRAAGQLARIGGEGVASEAEGRNRALYRQKHFIFDAVLGALDARTLQNATRESVKTPIERAVDAAIREFNLSLDQHDRNWMVEEFVREVVDLGPLVGLLEDVSVNKVLVVGSTDVAVERLGRIERTGVSFRDDDHLLSVVRRIAELTGGRIDAKVPLLDRPLPDGARIRAKIPPLSPQPTLTVEKSTGNPFLALKRQQAERKSDNALPYSLLRERIQQRLLREFEGNAAALANPDRLRTQVEEMIGVVIAEEKVAVTRAERAALVMDLLNEIVGLGPIEPLLNDPDVDEVMVNGPFQIYVERKGKLEIAPQRFRDNAHVMQVIERIVAPLGRRVDEKSPMVDGRLRDGSRFNAIIPPLALSGPTMTIRKFARDPLTMTDLINFGSLSREAAQFLQAAVEGRLNIVVSGGTGSGKTTTLNVLSSFIPSTERIVTIEDAAELQLRQEHIVRLETRPANIEGAGEIAIRDLVRNSLRMRPDRIVVGECRGGEALDMLQAMNTGHDGSLTTAHSNGPRDTVKRLETMVMMSGFDLPMRAIREQISMAVHLIVHQERMRDGKRRITAITELVGMEGEVITMQDLFRFEQERVDEEGRIIGSLNATGLRPHNYDHIVDNGGQLSMDMFQPRSMGGRDGDLRSRLSEHRVGTR